MPEGDTIHRTAARLRPAIEGKEVVRFEAPRVVGRVPHVGDEVATVEAVGKHLLVHFASGLILQTHMKMTGSWHLYRSTERWQKPQHLMRALIEVDGWVAVCFAAPVVRIYHEKESRPAPVAHLGPDLCTPDPDFDEAVDRMRTIVEPGTVLADVLLDQRVVSGIGNVYKSEALWANRLSPFAPIESLDEESRRALLTTAWKQLRANLTTSSRTTVPGGLAVYGRNRRPCRACGTVIERRTHGVHSRSTYWCPQCQGGSDG